MKYDVRLDLEYAYQPPVAGGRHLVRVMPLTVAGVQRVVASSILFLAALAQCGFKVEYLSRQEEVHLQPPAGRGKTLCRGRRRP